MGVANVTPEGYRPFHTVHSIARPLVIALLLIAIAGPYAVLAQSPPTINDRFVRLGDTIQGFGGMYVDPKKDTLYIWVVPGQQMTPARIKQAIGNVFGPDAPPQTNLVILDAQYSFRQLLSWQDYAASEIFSIPDVVSTAIHHRTNRLEVGASSPKAGKAVAAKVKELGIPLHAVEIVHEDPLQPQACTTIQGKCRPVVAGLQIQHKTFACSLGFSATAVGDDNKEYPGFITAGHCGDQEYRNTGTIYYQNEKGDGNKIGKEAKNPPLVDGPWEYNDRNKCYKGEKCRLSDSLFAKYEGDLDIVKDVKVGFIARPTFGGTDWNGTDYFRIVAPGMSVDGATVAKVGRSTGFTEGEVLRVCATARLFAEKQAFLCQNRAKVPFQQGDSGGPVFICADSTKPCSKSEVFDVFLLGILSNGNSSHMYYSDIGLIQNEKTELGKLTKFCDPAAKNKDCS